MKLTVVVDSDFMETCGTGSLSGMLIEKFGLACHEAEEIVLEFPQTSHAWRYRHGGPDSWVMPEFAVPTLIKNVLLLTSQGIKVSVRTTDQPGIA